MQETQRDTVSHYSLLTPGVTLTCFWLRLPKLKAPFCYSGSTFALFRSSCFSIRRPISPVYITFMPVHSFWSRELQVSHSKSSRHQICGCPAYTGACIVAWHLGKMLISKLLNKTQVSKCHSEDRWEYLGFKWPFSAELIRFTSCPWSTGVLELVSSFPRAHSSIFVSSHCADVP